MPELPDIETFKRYADATSMRQKINGVEISKARILKDVTEKQLARTLKNRCFRGSARHGKYLAPCPG